jgi:hypothetical protein
MLRRLTSTIGLTLVLGGFAGCSKQEATSTGPVTQDSLKIAQEEEKKVQDAEMAEQMKAVPPGQ